MASFVTINLYIFKSSSPFLRGGAEGGGVVLTLTILNILL